MGVIDSPFDMPYLSFGNIRMKWTVQADVAGLLWKDPSVYGTAYFFAL